MLVDALNQMYEHYIYIKIVTEIMFVLINTKTMFKHICFRIKID